MADEIIKKTALTAGVFILLATIGTLYFVNDGDNLYGCNATEEEIVGLCNKLSSINDDGLQTRCYYDLESPTRYKNCATGWYSVESVNVTLTGDIAELETFDDTISEQAKDLYIAQKELTEDQLDGSQVGYVFTTNKKCIVYGEDQVQCSVCFAIDIGNNETNSNCIVVPTEATKSEIETIVDAYISEMIESENAPNIIYEDVVLINETKIVTYTKPVKELVGEMI